MSLFFLQGAKSGLLRGAIDILDMRGGNGQYLNGKKHVITGVLGSTTSIDENDPTWTAYGLSFNGKNYVNCGRPSALEISRPFCVYFVGYFNANSNWECPFAKCNEANGSPTSKGFLVLKTGTNEVCFYVFTSDGELRAVYSAAIPASGWYYFFCGWDGAKIVNRLGRMATKYAAAPTYAPDVSFQLCLGKPSFILTALFSGQEAIIIPCAQFHGPSEEQRNYSHIKRLMAARGIAI